MKKIILVVGGVCNIVVGGAVLMGYEPNALSVPFTYVFLGAILIFTGLKD
jgi:hypothetical protein